MNKEILKFLGISDYKDLSLENILKVELPYTDDMDEVMDISDEIIFFLKGKKIPNFNLSQNALGICEIVKNANYHGGNYLNQHTSHFTLMINAPKYVLSSFDGGDYFSRIEVKNAWENKIIFPEKHFVNHYFVGCGLGTGLIYEIFEKILVKTNSKTLFVCKNI